MDDTGVADNDNTVRITYQGAPVTIPSLNAVLAHRAALQQWLMDRAQSRGGEMRVQEGADLFLMASPYNPSHPESQESLLFTLCTADRLLVLGDPGAGKTVALERLAWKLCEGSEPLVPVLVSLFDYTGAPLAERVRSELNALGYFRLEDARALAAFLTTDTVPVRCFFLFDGLDEIAQPYRDALVDELRHWMADYPRHAVICTSRQQDETWRRLHGEMRAVVVQPVDDEQAEGYLMAHLGSEKGRALYARLDERRRAMARRPLFLWLIKEAGKAGDGIPGTRGELYAQAVFRMLHCGTGKRIDVKIPESLKHRALAELAYVLGLKQRLFCSREQAIAVVAKYMKPEKAPYVIEACLRQGLLAGEETISFAPHPTVQEYFAAVVLLKRWKQEEGEGPLDRALRIGAALAGEPQGVLRLAVQDGWAETFVQLAGLSEDAEGLALAVLRVNPWLAWRCAEEGHEIDAKTKNALAVRAAKLLESERVDDRRRAVKILAQMGDDRTVAPLFKAAGDADAEVASTALWVLGKRAEAVRPLVEAALSAMDVRRWKLALRYLIAYPDASREDLIEPLFCIAADANIEIAQMAVQVLGQMREAVRPVVEATLRGTDSHQRKSAFRYLAMQPQDLLGKEIPWDWKKALGSEMVYMPPGPFEMGSDREGDGDPLAGDNEVPSHQVTLPGYWIGKTPVTAAQFRPFVQAIKDRMLLMRRNRWYGYHWFDSTPFTELPDDSSVVGVSWDDAALYCYLLSRSSGLTVMLPSEAEWEKAKQGTAGQLPDCVEVNLKGNVWEWTRSLWGRNQDSPDFKYPYDPYDGRESLEVYGLRVVRGWAKRLCRYPYVRDESLGFRLVLSPYSISDFWFLPEAGV